ncbi:MAG: hypothetical protein M1820_003993 [Bogoriella megaspora]|nr:MAG: hypothetical protein M1820_003993 [Bogoriella megaspora]
MAKNKSSKRSSGTPSSHRSGRGGSNVGGARKKRGGYGNSSSSNRSNVSEPTTTFSLRDAARNTERHSGSTLSTHQNVSLRYQSMKFVSGGSMGSTLPQDDESNSDDLLAKPAVDMASQSGQDVPHAAFAALEIGPQLDGTAESKVSAEQVGHSHSEASGENTSQLLFVEDKVGDASLKPTDVTSPFVRAPSPTPSNSSDEEIIFKGRGAAYIASKDKHPIGLGQDYTETFVVPHVADAEQSKPDSPDLWRPSTPPEATSTSIKPTDNELAKKGVDEVKKPSWDNSGTKWSHREDKTANNIRARKVPLHNKPNAKAEKQPRAPSWDDSGTKWSHKQNRSANKPYTGKNQVPLHGASNFPSSRRSKSARKSQNRALRDLDEDVFEDYISNMIANGEDDLIDRHLQPTPRVLALDEAQDPAPQHGQTTEDRQRHRPHGAADRLGGWEASGFNDFDAMSTSAEPFGDASMILRKRTRPGGVQYLVVHTGEVVDEARWRPVHTITGTEELRLVAEFEEENSQRLEYDIGNTSDDSDEDSNDGEFTSKFGLTDIDDSEDEEDGEGDEYEDYRDEEDLIERRKARLTDERIARILAKQEELGIDSKDIVLFDEDFDDGEDSGWASTKKRNKTGLRRTHSGRRYEQEQPYGDFDVMDFERPSLQPPSKKNFPDVAFNLSDDEMIQQMQDAWENDRRKKAVRKQEREQLRAEGLLLEGKTGKVDLAAKYRQGMNLYQVKEELRIFLQSSQDSKAFPPMEKNGRELLHAAASIFKINSKSRGNGNARFTVLTKTKRTRPFDDGVWQMKSGRFHKMSRHIGPVPQAKTPQRGGFAGNNPGDSYRDGDIVGSGAAELGVDNRGRAMLEKMGWSKGMALGSVENKGILQPIEQVMKRTRTGLG